MTDETLPPDNETKTPETDRRAFLKGAGKYALVVPPAMTFLLSTTLTSEAVAQSAGGTTSGGTTSGGTTTSYPTLRDLINRILKWLGWG